MAGEIESGKDHACIPMEVRTQKARLAWMTAGSKAGQIVSRAGCAGSSTEILYIEGVWQLI